MTERYDVSDEVGWYLDGYNSDGPMSDSNPTPVWERGDGVQYRELTPGGLVEWRLRPPLGVGWTPVGSGRTLADIRGDYDLTEVTEPASGGSLTKVTMTYEELRDYASRLILAHARDVEWLTVFEMAEAHVGGGEISDIDANEVMDLIRAAKITVSFPRRRRGAS